MINQKFNIGDRVVVNHAKTKDERFSTKFSNRQTDQDEMAVWIRKYFNDHKGTVAAIKSYSHLLPGHEHIDYFTYHVEWDEKKLNRSMKEFPGPALKLVNKSNTTFMSNLIAKFKELTLSEPSKSFRKAGIENENGAFTQSGQELFLEWLKEKHGDEFKEEVVDQLLEEQE